MVSGAISSTQSGVAVTLSYTVPGGTIINRTVTTTSDGGYNETYTPSVLGMWSIKASWAGDDQYYSAESNVVQITVGAAPKQNSTLTLQPSTANTTVNTTITLSGALTPSQSGTVALYQSFNGSSFAFIANATLASGSYTHSCNLTNAGTYAFYAYWMGDDDYLPATSPTATVISRALPALKVTPSVTIATSKNSVTLDANHTSETITVIGTLTPFVAPTQMLIKVTDPTSTTTTTTVDSTNGTFSAQVSINREGNWNLQAEIPAGDAYNLAQSSTVTVAASRAVVSADYTTYIIVGAVIAVAIVVVAIFMLRGKK